MKILNYFMVVLFFMIVALEYYFIICFTLSIDETKKIKIKRNIVITFIFCIIIFLLIIIISNYNKLPSVNNNRVQHYELKNAYSYRW